MTCKDCYVENILHFVEQPIFYGTNPKLSRVENKLLQNLQLQAKPLTCVPCGGPKKSPRTSPIMQIIFFFRSFEISKNIQRIRNVRLEPSSKHFFLKLFDPVGMRL